MTLAKRIAREGRDNRLSANTLELAANFLFYQQREIATRGRDMEAHKDALEGLRVTRAELTDAVIGDVHDAAQAVLKEREERHAKSA